MVGGMLEQEENSESASKSANGVSLCLDPTVYSRQKPVLLSGGETSLVQPHGRGRGGGEGTAAAELDSSLHTAAGRHVSCNIINNNSIDNIQLNSRHSNSWCSTPKPGFLNSSSCGGMSQVSCSTSQIGCVNPASCCTIHRMNCVGSGHHHPHQPSCDSPGSGSQASCGSGSSCASDTSFPFLEEPEEFFSDIRLESDLYSDLSGLDSFSASLAALDHSATHFVLPSHSQ